MQAKLPYINHRSHGQRNKNKGTYPRNIALSHNIKNHYCYIIYTTDNRGQIPESNFKSHLKEVPLYINHMNFVMKHSLKSQHKESLLLHNFLILNHMRPIIF